MQSAPATALEKLGKHKTGVGCIYIKKLNDIDLNVLKEMIGKYPIVTLTGPRQSGKSTLLKYSFPDYQYVSLEDPDVREYAQTPLLEAHLSVLPCKNIIS